MSHQVASFASGQCNIHYSQSTCLRERKLIARKRPKEDACGFSAAFPSPPLPLKRISPKIRKADFGDLGRMGDIEYFEELL